MISMTFENLNIQANVGADNVEYVVASGSRIDKIIGLFCRISSLL